MNVGVPFLLTTPNSAIIFPLHWPRAPPPLPLPPPSALFCQIPPPLLLIIRQKTAVWRHRSNLPLTWLPKYKTQSLQDDDAKDDVACKYPHSSASYQRQNLKPDIAVHAINAWRRWQGWEEGRISREQGREGSSCRFTLLFCGIKCFNIFFQEKAAAAEKKALEQERKEMYEKQKLERKEERAKYREKVKHFLSLSVSAKMGVKS